MKSTDERLSALKRDLEGDCRQSSEVYWAVTVAIESRQMLRAQQNAVDEAARNWRKIGYDAGKSDGYDEACRDLSENRTNPYD